MRLWESVKRALDSLPRHDAVPPELTERAVIPGIPGARFWMDRDLGAFVRNVLDADRRERAALTLAPLDSLPAGHLLAISGGGDAGAFAAGILSGWTQH